jgi:hypothetical protein
VEGAQEEGELSVARLSVEQMEEILARRQAEVRAAGQSWAAFTKMVFRRRAANADEAAMTREFEAILAELPPETAAKLRLLDQFADVLAGQAELLREWTHALNEVEGPGWGQE